MNILLITTHSPFETKSGAHQRTKMIFEILCTFATVDLICFSSDRKPNEPFPGSILYWGSPSSNKKKPMWSFLWFWHRKFLFPRNRRWAKIIRETLAVKKYDRIIVRYIQNAMACALELNHHLVIDADDLPEEHFRTAAKSAHKSIIRKAYYLFASRLARYHTSVMARKCHCMFVANPHHCGSNYVCLPNLPIRISPDKIIKDIPENKNIFFVSLLSYPPNQNGMAHFLKHIWPQIRATHPDANLRIAGNGLPLNLQCQWSSNAGVSLLGFVPDIISEYNQSRIVIVPIYQGSGTNVKVLEAMQMNRPCVVSLFACRGFEDLLVDGLTALVAQNDEEFAEKVGILLTNSTIAQQIADQAAHAIPEYYEQQSVSEIIKKYLL